MSDLRFSQEELEQIEDLAACNYSPEQVAKYLDVSKEEFMGLWYNHKSPVRFHYDRGQLVAEFEINQKALETAKAGNLTAMQIYQKNREIVKMENLKKQILMGGETLEDDEESQDTEV